MEKEHVKEEQVINIRKSTARVYKITIEKPFYSWAHITIDEWDRGGSINIQSDYGSFSYSWGNIGPGVLREFLCGLDYGYFMGKAAPGKATEFSIENTIKELKAELLTQRKANDITKENARICWTDIKDLTLWTGDNESEYTSALQTVTTIGKLMYGDCWECIPFSYVDNPQCVAFWERLWPIACDAWKLELKTEAALV